MIRALAIAILALLLPSFAQAAELPGATKDDVRQLQSACAGGDMIRCVNLGVLYRHGAGVERDPRKALELFVSACEKGFSLACAFTGDMAFLGSGVAPNSEHGQALMQAACIRRNEWACETMKRHGLIPRDAVS